MNTQGSVRRKRVRLSLVSLLLFVFVAQLIRVAHVTSACWDEAHHLFDGYTIWTKHDYTLNPEVPPLIKLVAAVPLLPMSLSAPHNEGRAVPTEAFLDGRLFVFGNGGDRVLFPARMACLLISLALAGMVYVGASRMFGWSAGLFALAFFVFDPNFLAHGTYVTTDVGSSCLFLASIFTFFRFCRDAHWVWLLGTCVCAGLLLVAKFTGIFLFPMLLACVFLELIVERKSALLARRLAAIALVAVTGWACIWMFYGFRYSAAPGGRTVNPALPAYLAQSHNPAQAHALGWIASHRLLPEAFVWGLENTKETEFQDKSYFFGKLHRHGVVGYFPATFLIKSTVSFLVLLLLIPFAWRDGRRIWREMGFLLIPVAIYFAVCTQSHMNIGLRHLLPVYPFLYVLIGGVAAALLRRDHRWSYAVCVLLIWQCTTSVRAASSYMAYGNELWGGPSQVHRYLSNSSTDWGQQLKSVKAYLEINHIQDCWFAYNADGAIEPSDYGTSCKRLPTTDNLFWLDLPMQVPPVISGTVLISDSDLEGNEFGDGPLNPYDSFRGIHPVAAIENGVYVYRGTFNVPLAAALVQSHAADELFWSGKPKEALPYARAAVALAPESAMVQMTAGNVLDAIGNPEAKEHYEMAKYASEHTRPELDDWIAKAATTQLAKWSTPPNH